MTMRWGRCLIGWQQESRSAFEEDWLEKQTDRRQSVLGEIKKIRPDLEPFREQSSLFWRTKPPANCEAISKAADVG